MDKNYKEAFAEVLNVIKNSDEDIKNKIPQKIIAFLENNEDKSYIVKIDYNDFNWENSLKQESLAVLALIYRDYIVSPEKREELLIEEQEEFTKFDKELKENYNSDNIFKNYNYDIQTKDDTHSKKEELTEYKESVFTKIKKWLKHIFIR